MEDLEELTALREACRMNSSSNELDKELVSMFEDFPVGGPELDIPDVGVSETTEIDVDDLLGA